MAADEDQLLLLRKVHGLGDLDLAALLSLIAREHCIVGTETPALDDLVAELRLVASRTFGLESAVVDCTPLTTLDDLASAILVQQQQQPPPPSQQSQAPPRSASTSPLVPRSKTDSYFHPHHHQNHHHHHHNGRRHGSTSAGGPANNDASVSSTHGGQAQPSPLRTLAPIPAAAAAASPRLGYGYGHNYNGAGSGGGRSKTPSTPHIANVIIAKNLDAAPKAVQIQCLELLRTRRLFTRTSVQTAPKQFLFVAVLGSMGSSTQEGGGGGGGPNSIAGRLTPHFNDHFYIAHWHDPVEDGFPHLEGDDGDEEERGEEEEQERGIGGGGDYDEYGDGNDSVRVDTASFESAESVIRRSVAGTPRIDFSGAAAASAKERNNTSRGGSSRHRSTTITSGGYREDNDGNKNNNTFDTDNEDQQQQQQSPPLLSEHDIATLALATCKVAVDVEVLRYEMNVVSFLRLHRAVAVTGATGPSGSSGGGGGGGVGSVTPTSTKHLQQLVRSLAVLHGLAYATPALVGLAVRKAYLHRIRVLGSVERERSMQWGSDRAAVVALLDGVGAEEVIDEVLGAVDAPL